MKGCKTCGVDLVSGVEVDQEQCTVHAWKLDYDPGLQIRKLHDALGTTQFELELIARKRVQLADREQEIRQRRQLLIVQVEREQQKVSIRNAERGFDSLELDSPGLSPPR